MRKNGATATTEPTINDTTSAAELPAVELDPPTAELVHWHHLAARYETVKHKGDASKLMRMPRPDWSDPDLDMIGASPGACVYRSPIVKVPVSTYRGLADEDEGAVAPAYISVSTQLLGDHRLMLSVCMSYVVDGEWSNRFMRLFPDEATELANVLLAGVALAESTGDR